jgi:hypothetical protein
MRWALLRAGGRLVGSWNRGVNSSKSSSISFESVVNNDEGGVGVEADAAAD